MTETPATVAVDAMGGDHAPEAVLDGVRAALDSDPSLTVLLVGTREAVSALRHERCTPVYVSSVIGMDEHPAKAVRNKRDSSISVACRLVREGAAGAFFSAGNTGACMAAATLEIGRLPGVLRPALATVIPGRGRPTVLLDVGANADVKPRMLVQFAHMGTAYARIMLDVQEPHVALLNIGEEASKGSALAREAHALLAEEAPGFVGNVEGRDIASGVVDVIVTDGFTGNVALKVLEGLSKVLFTELKEALTSSIPRKLAAAALQSSLSAIKDRMDPDAYGGAPLLGVKGVCMIGHGSSNPRAVASGIGAAARAVRGGLTGSIASAISLDPSGRPAG